MNKHRLKRNTVIVIIIFMPFLINFIYSYFSDVILNKTIATSGNLAVKIKDLKVYKEESECISGCFVSSNPNLKMSVNSIIKFSFDVENIGTAGIATNVYLNINFNDDLNESGVILLYPSTMSDLDILNELSNGNDINSLIDLAAPDNNVIVSSEGIFMGFNKIIDYNRKLDSSLSHGTGGIASIAGETKHHYEYKLVFLDGETVNNTYNDVELEININVDARLHNLTNGWQDSDHGFFKVKTEVEGIVDENDPVLMEVSSMPKTFYISQASNIDLSSYITAFDLEDGDLKDNIIISSKPTFNKNKPGTYEITYNVEDSAGNSATSITIPIVIWNFVKVESGSYHTLALTSHGKVWAWGYNAEGQIGKGSSGNATIPILLGLANVVDIAANLYSSYAVTSDGNIYSWGYGASYRLGNNSTSNRNSPGLVTMPDGVKFVKVSAGYSSAVALTDDGEVYVWGDNSYGMLGDGTATDKRVPTKLDGLSNIVDVSQGGFSGAAINQEGDLYTWGRDSTYYLLGDTTDNGNQNTPNTYSGLTNIKYVKVAYAHIIAISNTGQVYTWGSGSNGKLGNGSTSDSRVPYATSITNGEQASGFYLYHSLVKTTDGKLYVFGQNAYGKLGLGDTSSRNIPTLNSNGAFTSNGAGNVKWVSAMLDSSIILTEDSITKVSTSYGMGYNGSYQFGSGLIGDRNIPTAWNFVPPDPE